MKFSSSRSVIIVTIVGLLLAIIPLIVEWSFRSLYAPVSDSYVETSDSVVGEVVHIGYIFSWLARLFGYPVGTGLVFLALGSLYVKRQSLTGDEPRNRTAYALLVPLAGNLYMAIQSLVFLTFPRGTAIRPMGWTALMFMLSLAVSILCIIFVGSWVIRTKKFLVGALGAFLSLLPFVTDIFAFHLVVRVGGLILKE
ncbi:MAG: hypothetical protein ACYS30_04285 [Planctomycetota bacterium]|jgi:hypothetical protein